MEVYLKVFKEVNKDNKSGEVVFSCKIHNVREFSLGELMMCIAIDEDGHFTIDKLREDFSMQEGVYVHARYQSSQYLPKSPYKALQCVARYLEFKEEQPDFAVMKLTDYLIELIGKKLAVVYFNEVI